MRFVKLGIISVIFFALLITAFSLLLPSTINISRAIDINASPDSVYAIVNDLSKWKHWYADSSSSTIQGKSIGKGAILNLGKSSITITGVTDKKVEALWQMNSSSMAGEFNFISQNNTATTVQWHFVHKAKWYPWEKFASIVVNKRFGPFMEKSLENLKGQVEHQPQ